jgi:hypothetical protein
MLQKASEPFALLSSWLGEGRAGRDILAGPVQGCVEIFRRRSVEPQHDILRHAETVPRPVAATLDPSGARIRRERCKLGLGSMIRNRSRSAPAEHATHHVSKGDYKPAPSPRRPSPINVAG